MKLAGLAPRLSKGESVLDAGGRVVGGCMGITGGVVPDCVDDDVLAIT